MIGEYVRQDLVEFIRAETVVRRGVLTYDCKVHVLDLENAPPMRCAMCHIRLRAKR